MMDNSDFRPLVSADIAFLLYEWLDVVSLTERGRFAEHSRETFDAVLDLAERMAMSRFAPHNREADLAEPVMRPDGRVEMIPAVKEAVVAFGEAGLIAATQDQELGGMQLPQSVFRAALAWFQAANISTASYPFLTIGNAELIRAHGSPEQIETFVKPQLSGRWLGTMCLSEPQAGSSLADITTRASRQADGSYRLAGTKMWISAGEHELSENIVHLVLAKVKGTQGQAGVKSISLFIVPKYLPGENGAIGERNDVSLMGLNHKMGNRGTTNTVLAFGGGSHQPGGHDGAVGYLVGEENAGLSYMFHMMNGARIGVGMGATALGYAGYQAALRYAGERRQGRRPGAKDPSLPQLPIIEHADVKRMLLTQKAYVEGALALELYCARLVDEEKTAPDSVARSQATLLLDMLTPIAKAWPSQWCTRANDLAIQVHGGYGYTRDFNVEQYYRDNRLNSIHEGTDGIQAIDFLGRKMLMKQGAGRELLADTLRNDIQHADQTGGELATVAAQLEAMLNQLLEVTDQLWETGDAEQALANAHGYLQSAGHIVIAWIWLQQWLACHDKETGAFKSGNLYQGKQAAARYFFRYELPKVQPQLEVLARKDSLFLDLNTNWL